MVNLSSPRLYAGLALLAFVTVAPAPATPLPLTEGATLNGNSPSLSNQPVYPATVENFQASVQNGDLAEVRRMAGLKPDLVKAPNARGVSALHLASKPEVAQFLIEHGAPVDATDADGRTPLHWAVLINRSPQMVEFLVNHGADVNRLDGMGNNPLHLAVSTYNRESALFLQAHGAHDKTSALFEALAQNDEARVGTLLKANPQLANDALGDNISNTTRLVIATSLTPLHAAVLWGRAPMVRLLLAAKTNVNARDADNNTPLHKAAALNEPDIVALLLDGGSDINARAERRLLFSHGEPYESGFTPLHEAAQQGAVEAARVLIQRGAEVDALTEVKDNNGGGHFAKRTSSTPLVYAVQAGSTAMVALLLEHKANPNGGDAAGKPLLQALDISQYSSPSEKAKSLELARLLLRAGANPNVSDTPNSVVENTPLGRAIAANDVQLVTLLLDAGANANTPTSDGATVLHLALVESREGTANRNVIPKLLLAHGAGVNVPDKQGRMPLFQAVTDANVEMVRQLLAKGANAKATDAQGRTPILLSLASKGVPEYDQITTLLRAQGAGDAGSTLFEAIERGDAKSVAAAVAASPKLLLARSSLNETPLAHAIRHHQEAVVRVLLAHGADVEARSNGSSALFMAVDFGPASMVSLLLQHGAKVNARGSQGQTPLFWAVHNGSSDMIALLLQAGADVKVTDNEKRTPLHVCVDDSSLYDASPLVMNALLRAGADVNARDRDGETPLHLAAQNGKRLGIGWLVAHGAQVNARDNATWTPLHWASNRGHAQSVSLLKQHGAKL